MSAFIEAHRARFGVEPICRTLEVSASAYYERRSGRRSARAVSDQRLLHRIRVLHERNYCAYGYRLVWKALLREGEQVGRDRVARLMGEAGIQGAKRRGRPWRTTTPDPEGALAPDLVDRDFTAQRPNQLWVRMALALRGPGAEVGLVHHSDHGSQYTSSEFTQTLADAGVLASLGSTGDAYDNAMAESFVDSFKTELIVDRVWRSRSQLELAAVEYIAWFNHERLHSSLGDLPPVEFESLYAAEGANSAR